MSGTPRLPSRSRWRQGSTRPGWTARHCDTTSRTRPPAFLERLGEEMSVTLLPLGSAGAKAAVVMRGEADAYIHAGGQYEWDSAAPAAVALAAGLHASRLDGSALRYNQPDPVLPDILICPVVLAESLLEAIGAAGAPRAQ